MTLSPLSMTTLILPPTHCMFCWQKLEFIFRAYKNTQADNRPYSDNYRTNLKNMSKFWTILFFKSQQSGLSSIFVSLHLAICALKYRTTKRLRLGCLTDNKASSTSFYASILACSVIYNDLAWSPNACHLNYSVHWCFFLSSSLYRHAQDEDMKNKMATIDDLRRQLQMNADNTNLLNSQVGTHSRGIWEKHWLGCFEIHTCRFYQWVILVLHEYLFVSLCFLNFHTFFVYRYPWCRSRTHRYERT